MGPFTATLPAAMLVAFGGAFGSTMRWLMVQQVIKLNPTVFPLGTMLVNIFGSLLIGFMIAKYGAVHSTRIFFVTGVLGGFTTFSAFSWDALQLINRGQFFQAGVYIVGSVFLSIAAVALGYSLVK